jgi:hypothetical protein
MNSYNISEDDDTTTDTLDWDVDTSQILFSTSFNATKCLRYSLDLQPLGIFTDVSYIMNNLDIETDILIPIPHFYSSLTVCHFNLRDISTSTKFVDMCKDINCFPFEIDIIGVSETWCDRSNESSYQIQGFNCLALSRKTRGVGGCYLYVRNHLTIDWSTTYTNDDESTRKYWLC